MTKNILTLLLALCSFAFCRADEQATSKVLIYRDINASRSSLSFGILSNDSFLIKLRHKTFFEFRCKPNTYTISIENYDDAKLTFTTLPGQTYYIRLDVINGMWSAEPELVMVDSSSALPTIRSAEIRQVTPNDPPQPRPKNRVGLKLGIGWGLKSFKVEDSKNSETSNLSYGGGNGFGIKYGHEFNRYLDLSADISYVGSSLRPTMSYGEITFERAMVSITPAIIIPFDGGESMRLKLGGGADLYWAGLLNIETSRITGSFSLGTSQQTGGFNDKWKYKGSLGWHVSSIFELNVNENWMIEYGVSWNNVSYKFNSSKSNRTNITESMKNPDGSGIDIVCGIYYEF